MRRLSRALRRVGRVPGDIRQIVLTHRHGDHCGEAGALRDLTGAPLIAGAADVGVIEGRDPYPGPKVARGRLAYRRLTSALTGEERPGLLDLDEARSPLGVLEETNRGIPEAIGRSLSGDDRDRRS